MVAQVDEQHAAMVADAVAPAGQADRLADVALAERAAGMGAVAMHGIPKNRCRRVESGGQKAGPKLRQGLPEATGAATECGGPFWARKAHFGRIGLEAFAYSGARLS